MLQATIIQTPVHVDMKQFPINLNNVV